MDFSDEVTKKRAMRVLAIVIVIIIIVLIITTVTKFFVIPSLIGTILVVCVIAYLAHKIYVKKRQSSSASNLQRILVIQKKALRALAGLQPRQSRRPLFVELSILTVMSLYVLEAVVFVHKSNLPRGCTVHHHNPRHAADFKLPVHRMALFEEKLSYMGTKLLNHLLEDLKKANTRNLKNEIKKWLLVNPFYSLEDYISRRN